MAVTEHPDVSTFLPHTYYVTMQNRHTTSLDIKRSHRPGPIISAAESLVGKRSRGNDGNMYVVKMDARGIKRWAKSAKPKKTLRSRSRK